MIRSKIEEGASSIYIQQLLAERKSLLVYIDHYKGALLELESLRKEIKCVKAEVRALKKKLEREEV
jgi:hypothetical protein